MKYIKFKIFKYRKIYEYTYSKVTKNLYNLYIKFMKMGTICTVILRSIERTQFMSFFISLVFYIILPKRLGYKNNSNNFLLKYENVFVTNIKFVFIFLH